MTDDTTTEWPERLILRDTKIHADEGQRIYTTATGYGYEKREYVRADIALPQPPLSAAAPQLLEALEDLLDAYEPFDRFKEAAQEAIRAAKGA